MAQTVRKLPTVQETQVTLLYIKQTTISDPLHNTGNYTYYLVITYNGTECKKEYISVYMYN